MPEGRGGQGAEAWTLNAFDASNGVPLFARPMVADAPNCGRSQSGGVSVARHTVFAACGGTVTAYGPVA